MIARNSVRFFLSLAFVSVAAWIGSLVTLPSIDTWYAGLDKPFFSPPDWVFGPVWTVLYVFMAISLYLVWLARAERSKRPALVLFGTQLVLNVAWSVVFFGLHQPWVAVGVVGALWLAIAVTMGLFWPFSRLATYLLVPYLAWVSFAAGLNISVAMLNASSHIDSYEECQKAPGSAILYSYPSICITSDKKSFTNPNQHLDPPEQSTLSIPELSATIPLTSKISDAYYGYDEGSQEVYLTTTKLETALGSLGGCKSGLHGIYLKREGDALKEQSRYETLCMSPINQTTQLIRDVQEALRSAITAATI